MRLSCDVVDFASKRLPRFNPISITGYHAREAGCSAVQELGFTMSSAIAYSEALVERGLDFDAFAPRLSFHFATTMDLFEEVAKLRAARRLWYRIATDRFGAEDPASGRLRFFSGNSGTTLTAQQPLNNIVRSTIQCLGAVLGGAQSIHVMGYDEAFEIPSEEAVTLSLRTQQIVALESGVPRTADPLGGSFYVEALTDEMERRASEVMAEIGSHGGMVAALDAGVPQRSIAESAYRIESEIADGSRPRVGVNTYVDPSDAAAQEPDLFEVDPAIAERQIDRTEAHIAERGSEACDASIAAVAAAAREGTNVMPPLIDAVRLGATLGELSDVFREVFGEFREPHPW
jgi:methylmalonyl-CoA mutase N-terminal domain/subunit